MDGLRRWLRVACIRMLTAPLFLLLNVAGSLGAGTIDLSRVAIYIRWSTDDQSEGTTLDTQRDACIDYARSQGFGTVPPERIFIDDGYSGGNLERPAMKKLRQLVKRGEINCVVVYTIDRLSRNIVDAVNLVLHEWDRVCHVKCVKQPIDTTSDLGRMIFGILAMFADFERSQIRARTFGGRVKRAQQGRNPGGRLRVGYKKGENKGDIIVDEDGAQLVNRIFRLYSEGNGDRTIAALLNEEGIKSARGRGWERSTIGDILTSERYIGKWNWGSTKPNLRTEDGPQRVASDEPLAMADRPDLAIVPVELFEKVQSIRAQVNQALEETSGRALSSPHLLSGLIKCGKCGSAMQVNSDGRSRKRYKNKYYFFRCCGRLNKGAAFCDCGTVAERELNAIIVWHVEKFREPGIRARIEGGESGSRAVKLAAANAARTAVATELRRLETQLERIRLDYRAQQLAVSEYNAMRQDIESDTAEYKGKLERAERAITEHESGSKEHGRIAALLDTVHEWDTLTIAQQKSLLRDLINCITVYRPKQSTQNPELHIDWNVPDVVFDDSPDIANLSLDAN